MRWTYWFIELPARFVSIWFTFYWTVLSLFGFGLLVLATVSLVLAQFGIRWGW